VLRSPRGAPTGMAKGTTDARYLVGRDADANAVTADDHAKVGAAIDYRLRRGTGKIRVIHAARAVRPNIEHIVAHLPGDPHQERFQFIAGMVSAKHESHWRTLLDTGLSLSASVRRARASVRDGGDARRARGRTGVPIPVGAQSRERGTEALHHAPHSLH